jgi:hypothetical protein
LPVATRGSQRWLQVAVNHRPQVLHDALVRSGALQAGEHVTWRSPLEADDFREFRDDAALTLAGIANLRRRLADFWPARGPVWDAIGVTSAGRPLFVEAKAHIAEAASPGTRASESSKSRIVQSLEEARRFYAPRATASWCDVFYQYANRLAHHYFLREANALPSVLVFVYFTNDGEMNGPSSEEEWKGAVCLLHAVLGLPHDLRSKGVFEAFVDVQALTSLQPSETSR